MYYCITNLPHCKSYLYKYEVWFLSSFVYLIVSRGQPAGLLLTRLLTK